MKTTIGRIVLYRKSEDEVFPAIIVRVWTEDCVTLRVFTDGDEIAPLLVTSVGMGDGPRTWSWPQRS